MSNDYSIRNAASPDVKNIHEFHIQNAGEYVWPRTVEQLEEMVIARSVLIAEFAGKAVGMAYTRRDDEARRWEFGGAFVDPDHRGKGLAGILARIAIIAHFMVDNPTDECLIAHVHEENPSNIRKVLQKLGFETRGTETPPEEVVPPNMKRNKDGQVVGELYEFIFELGLPLLINWTSEDPNCDIKLDWYDSSEVGRELKQLVRDRTDG